MCLYELYPHRYYLDLHDILYLELNDLIYFRDFQYCNSIMSLGGLKPACSCWQLSRGLSSSSRQRERAKRAMLDRMIRWHSVVVQSGGGVVVVGIEICKASSRNLCSQSRNYTAGRRQT